LLKVARIRNRTVETISDRESIHSLVEDLAALAEKGLPINEASPGVLKLARNIGLLTTATVYLVDPSTEEEVESMAHHNPGEPDIDYIEDEDDGLPMFFSLTTAKRYKTLIEKG
jgi:hypothetical protein